MSKNKNKNYKSTLKTISEYQENESQENTISIPKTITQRAITINLSEEENKEIKTEQTSCCRIS